MLSGNFEDEKLTGYYVEQGDKVNGKCGRYTLGQIFYDAFKSEGLKDKVTFECQAIPNEDYKCADFSILIEDDKTKIVTRPFKKATRFYQVLFLLVILLIFLGSYWLFFTSGE